MEIKVLGCHGGESKHHRSPSFLLDGTLAIDAGSTTSSLTLEEQKNVETILVSHAHLDHVRDLAMMADNRCQAGGKPVVVAGTPGTIQALKTHFFNNILWPDFSKIPLVGGGGGMTVVFQEMQPEQVYSLGSFKARAVMVSHTIEASGFVVEHENTSLAYSGDTGPTDRFWEVLSTIPSLRAVFMEVSFPNTYEWLAKVSGHHTPSTLNRDLSKLEGNYDPKLMPFLLYHIKPQFEREVHRELAKIQGRTFEIPSPGDSFLI